jgi:hypothetical protein
MIGHKSRRIASRFRLFGQIPKPIDEVVSVGVIFENYPPFDSILFAICLLVLLREFLEAVECVSLDLVHVWAGLCFLQERCG